MRPHLSLHKDGNFYTLGVCIPNLTENNRKVTQTGPLSTSISNQMILIEIELEEGTPPEPFEVLQSSPFQISGGLDQYSRILVKMSYEDGQGNSAVLNTFTRFDLATDKDEDVCTKGPFICLISPQGSADHFTLNSVILDENAGTDSFSISSGPTSGQVEVDHVLSSGNADIQQGQNTDIVTPGINELVVTVNHGPVGGGSSKRKAKSSTKLASNHPTG